VLVHIIWWFAHLLVFAGLFLIAHEILVSFGMSIILSSWFLDTISPIIACLSLLLVSISVYFEKSHRRPPTVMTIKFSAPFMIGLALIFFVVFLWYGSLTPHYVDALASIALGVAMMRSGTRVRRLIDTIADSRRMVRTVEVD
jgi:hypothetical protein